MQSFDSGLNWQFPSQETVLYLGENKDHYTRIIQRLERRFRFLCMRRNIRLQTESRLKTAQSLQEKMRRKQVTYHGIFDIIGIRLITDDIRSCYRCRDFILTRWPVLKRRTKDYIKYPKPNTYQSLHVTIMHGKYPVEIQIRTQTMHENAKYGPASYRLDKRY